MINSRAVVTATVVGTVLQLAMVLAGHSNASIAQMFAVGGMGISLVAGGACALIGICVSYLLGDVTAVILAAGTLSSAVTGAIGGWLGHLMFGSARATA